MLPGKARKVGDSLAVDPVASCAGGNAAIGHPLVEQFLALGCERRVVVSPECCRLRRVVAGDAIDDRIVKCCRDAPHEIVGIFFGSRSFPKCLDLIFQVSTVLRGKYRELGRSADASWTVARRTEVDRFVLRGLLNRCIVLSSGRGSNAQQHTSCNRQHAELHRQLLHTPSRACVLWRDDRWTEQTVPRGVQNATQTSKNNVLLSRALRPVPS